jgi:thiosulfate dehydrogenase [quinone] large subunit
VPGTRHWLARLPARSPLLAGWALLPLRAFLGITFCVAGLQKLANPNFFTRADPAGIYAQMVAADRISPLHFALGHLLRFSTPIGLVIAFGELAIGLGVLAGLWTRVAAGFGALLSLSLFLTVSYHAAPYYTGADIVFVFAWTPLIVAGSGGVLSIDAALADRRRAARGRGPGLPVTVPFATIQRVCGQFEAGRCRARQGAECDPAPCPFLRHPPVPAAAPREPGQMTRRQVVLSGTAAAAVGAIGLAAAGAAAGIGRAVGGAKPAANQVSLRPPATPPTTAPSGGPSTTSPGGRPIGLAKDVPVGGSAAFNDPTTQFPSLVIQLERGQFVAYDAVCPHAGCTVGYVPSQRIIACPCHGSEFNPDTGAVIQGPAATGLRRLTISEAGNGELYVRG